MIIEITGKTTIRDIQEQFQKTYPYLLIRFSDKHHEFGAPTNKGYWYAPSCRLHDIMSKPKAFTDSDGSLNNEDLPELPKDIRRRWIELLSRRRLRSDLCFAGC